MKLKLKMKLITKVNLNCSTEIKSFHFLKLNFFKILSAVRKRKESFHKVKLKN